MPWTDAPTSLRAAIVYLGRHPRVRITHADYPDRPYPAIFRFARPRTPGVHYGRLLFQTPKRQLPIWIVGGDSLHVAGGKAPPETGLIFRPHGFEIDHGPSGLWIEYLDGPARRPAVKPVGS